jgi:phosphoribosyl 1,2-cyclic phosphodiesterase
MIVRFWGVRGSIAVPGEATLRYGGNTSCVSVELDGRLLVLDAGTGIRNLARSIEASTKDIVLLVTHPHADHVAGFAFFTPLYETERCVNVFDFDDGDVHWSPLSLYDGLHSPVHVHQAVAVCRRILGPNCEGLREMGFDARCIALNHPGGAWGYRLTEGARSFVYMTDNELDAAEPRTSFDEFAAFCHGADVLCHDAQYIDGEMPQKVGWGHSTVNRVCDLAIAAGVRRLILFHHDPGRTDAALDGIAARATERLSAHGIHCDVAWEGLMLEV